ncbi:hypothetical protein SAMN05216532_0109 [Streptomyces sp. 2231.1]|uniref:hypothetical protein n=1 Tax=Streptomyces sp. 2231.1 TaxID=1855347 RepID=UPI0008977F23|nr:hypothetical protein [Streptomyces sp. 2231.1]SEB98625.1 hypothetical protein SAMN05216532_0109 [Streptomyces sp. 2231.1]
MTAAAARVGRFYTSVRRHPWVLGKVADWHIPLGPYTPAQITVAVGGGFFLVKTISWWSWLGPLPPADDPRSCADAGRVRLGAAGLAAERRPDRRATPPATPRPARWSAASPSKTPPQRIPQR